MSSSGRNADGSAPRQLLDEICRRYSLADLYVFGSRAVEISRRFRSDGAPAEPVQREARPESDVDVGIRPLRGVHLNVDVLVELTGELERLLDALRVDLVLLTSAPPFLALDVIRGELLYCADPDEQAEHELYVLRRAGDLAPFQRIREELALSRYEHR
jgi:predicted nucleotidyltransferase